MEIMILVSIIIMLIIYYKVFRIFDEVKKLENFWKKTNTNNIVKEIDDGLMNYWTTLNFTSCL